MLERVHQGRRDGSDLEAFGAQAEGQIWQVVCVERVGKQDVCAEAFEVGQEAGRSLPIRYQTRSRIVGRSEGNWTRILSMWAGAPVVSVSLSCLRWAIGETGKFHGDVKNDALDLVASLRWGYGIFGAFSTSALSEAATEIEMPYGEMIGANDVESVLPSDFLGRVAWRRVGRHGEQTRINLTSASGAASSKSSGATRVINPVWPPLACH